MLITDSTLRFIPVDTPPGEFAPEPLEALVERARKNNLDLQAAQKDPADEISPASKEEYFYFHGDAEGRAIPVVAETGKTVDLGILQAGLWSPELIRRENGITAVEGMVIDQDLCTGMMRRDDVCAERSARA